MDIKNSKYTKPVVVGALALLIAAIAFVFLTPGRAIAKPVHKAVHHASIVKPPVLSKQQQAQALQLHLAYYHNHHLPPAPPPAPVPSPTPGPAPVQPSSTNTASGISIPGMPQSLANCIWFRESTNGTNPAAGGNQFGIIPASGFSVAGDSVQQQEQVAGQIYAQSGGAAWAADGCPGT